MGRRSSHPSPRIPPPPARLSATLPAQQESSLLPVQVGTDHFLLPFRTVTKKFPLPVRVGAKKIHFRFGKEFLASGSRNAKGFLLPGQEVTKHFQL